MGIERKLFENQSNLRGVLRQNAVKATDGRRAERSLKVGKLDQRDSRVCRTLGWRSGNWNSDWLIEHGRRFVQSLAEFGAHLLDRLAFAQLPRRRRGQAPAARAIRIFDTALGNFQRAAAIARLRAQ